MPLAAYGSTAPAYLQALRGLAPRLGIPESALPKATGGPEILGLVEGQVRAIFERNRSTILVNPLFASGMATLGAVARGDRVLLEDALPHLFVLAQAVEDGIVTLPEPAATMLAGAAAVPVPDAPAVELLSSPINSEHPLVAALRSFSMDLFTDLLAEATGNVIASPFSMAIAVSMALQGAKGGTEEGIRRALRLSRVPPQDLNDAFRALFVYLNHLDPEVALKIANAIFVNPAMTVRPEFQEMIGRVYGGRVDRLPEVGEVNRWISERTDGKITKMLDRIDPLVAALLINAIAFKAKWTNPFPMDNTSRRDFMRGTGTRVSVPMMSHGQFARYTERDGWQFLWLPYSNERLGMLLALPPPVRAAVGTSPRLNGREWARISSDLQQVRPRKGLVVIPKFDAKFGARPNDWLKEMGMTDAYDDVRADFSGMVESAPGYRPGDPAANNVYISDVLHRARISVNEEGTEATATTVVEMEFNGMPDYDFEFVANRPFLYAVQDSATHLPLFVGWVDDPSKTA